MRPRPPPPSTPAPEPARRPYTETHPPEPTAEANRRGRSEDHVIPPKGSSHERSHRRGSRLTRWVTRPSLRRRTSPPALGRASPAPALRHEAAVDREEVRLGHRARVGHRHPQQDLSLALRVADRPPPARDLLATDSGQLVRSLRIATIRRSRASISAPSRAAPSRRPPSHRTSCPPTISRARR